MLEIYDYLVEILKYFYLFNNIFITTFLRVSLILFLQPKNMKHLIKLQIDTFQLLKLKK